MSNAVSINIEKREELGSANARRIRRAGMIPAVVYGHGNEAKAVKLSPADAAKVEYHTGLVELNCCCGAKKMAIVKEVQHHTISLAILHIDFQEVEMNEVITSAVPVVLEGEAAGTKQGGQLEQVMMTIEIKSLPANMPEQIVVDVTNLELDSAIHVRDLALPEGVSAAAAEDLVVCHVRVAKAEEAEAPAEAPAEEKK